MDIDVDIGHKRNPSCIDVCIWVWSFSSTRPFHRHVHYSVPLGCHTPLLTFPGRLPYPTLTCPYTDLALGSAERNNYRVVERKRSAFKRGYRCHGMLPPSGIPWHLWSGLNSLLLRFTTLHFARHCPASPYTAHV